ADDSHGMDPAPLSRRHFCHALLRATQRTGTRPPRSTCAHAAAVVVCRSHPPCLLKPHPAATEHPSPHVF
uniref:Uncharacterized protein n=1 Tax=Aegilops tauschii subsp. strangulata TaxID=200361 RepID=A0A453DTT1_AEGTS